MGVVSKSGCVFHVQSPGNPLFRNPAYGPAAGETEGGDPWQELPLICTWPLPPSKGAIPSAPLASSVEVLTAPNNSGDESNVSISAYANIASILASSGTFMLDQQLSDFSLDSNFVFNTERLWSSVDLPQDVTQNRKCGLTCSRSF